MQMLKLVLYNDAQQAPAHTTKGKNNKQWPVDVKGPKQLSVVNVFNGMNSYQKKKCCYQYGMQLLSDLLDRD